MNVKKEDLLIQTMRETQELNDLMKSYIKVSMDNKNVDGLQIINELEKIKSVQKDFQKQLIEIGVHILPSHYYTLIKAYRNKGIALDGLEEFELAIECYDKALELDPDDYGSLLNKGIALEQLGDSEESIKNYDHVISGLAPLIEMEQSSNEQFIREK